MTGTEPPRQAIDLGDEMLARAREKLEASAEATLREEREDILQAIKEMRGEKALDLSSLIVHFNEHPQKPLSTADLLKLSQWLKERGQSLEGSDVYHLIFGSIAMLVTTGLSVIESCKRLLPFTGHRDPENLKKAYNRWLKQDPKRREALDLARRLSDEASPSDGEPVRDKIG